ncbi:hypothetical protein [Bacillus sp. REN3]|uniref:hypothetical protein n=1 Tax=Bacillus sp. REN3 TaxID=2802440 RepID=UPI001AED2A0A|nr:hypothetical protein [Bacillus sp. REN3]
MGRALIGTAARIWPWKLGPIYSIEVPSISSGCSSLPRAEYTRMVGLEKALEWVKEAGMPRSSINRVFETLSLIMVKKKWQHASNLPEKGANEECREPDDKRLHGRSLIFIRRSYM